ncbi:MAG: hypothetical protein FWG10_01035 [Eubacteriaceae bacterium]|nr:hypothetical protein [Eubacteriaceae bacterium]
MSKQSRKKKKETTDVATEQFSAGYQMLGNHPLFNPLLRNAAVIRREENTRCPQNGLAIVDKEGYIYANPKKRADSAEWARALAHCLLHLGMGHFKEHDTSQREWNMACDCIVEKFLTELKFAKPFYDADLPPNIPNEEQRLFKSLCGLDDKSEYEGFGTAGPAAFDMLFDLSQHDHWRRKPAQWEKLFASSLASAVRSAVRVAAGELSSLTIDVDELINTNAFRAKRWFISSYPLLGAIASGFKVIEDSIICQRMEISIAAVSPSLQEIYINPAYPLDEMEMRFVIAHEYLHAALRHDERKDWRDAYLWNVACDFVINMWLSEMRVGERPEGLLYDAQFKGMNAEGIYDRIVTDMRTYRKLATLRGVGLGDIIPGEDRYTGDTDLDAFYRKALSQGLTYHQEQERGYLPEGLVEEIRALMHPPIPWDVELAHWFDDHFTPIEKIRSYARPSRRQSSTPDIPRPNWVVSQLSLDGRTFGVVLDTSGSMDRSVLASALGAIASYSYAKDVPAARVVFCDAEAYDNGYMKPEDIAGEVKVKGRGGTILQPGIDLLDRAEDFPKDAPILVITDGYCDKVVMYGRDHAFLIPHGATLPFEPKGKVFRMKN